MMGKDSRCLLLQDIHPDFIRIAFAFTNNYGMVCLVHCYKVYLLVFSRSTAGPMEDLVFLGSKFPVVKEGTRIKNTKVVFNETYNTAIRLSDKAERWLRKHGYKGPIYDGKKLEIPRHNSFLVKCVEILGEEVNGECNLKGGDVRTDSFGTHLRICSIKGNAYHIEDYDGMEKVIGLDDMIIACPK